MSADEARSYIAMFCKHTIPGTDNVTTQTRTIWLDNMTDEEAIFVAEEFRRMEVEAASRRVRKPS